ncbi:signal peptidase I [Aerococcus sanguinicola]|uniref:Signal peptidase I n=1 Tax=Aerococcus sanguinicola TaxID=119206 RepID=A0A0X8FCG0_9LACT|nr:MULTISPECIES: signal peptidase I [Aerococcus]AMB94799.1 S26 family signal peptidase [Aerococcus sanguinicola]MDK7049570.1 signal peptidase I [Aerococcus sanguinicola]OFT96343.1 signal peptidase I [Aerococcus sp. HMSC23C02]PKZ23200.1 signal peptidase I [Aerococcus sanguinicola]
MKRFFNEVISFILPILIAVVLVLGVQKYIAFPINISGDSMAPTLHNGDMAIAYRLAEPDRGDIVVFPGPDAPNEKYIKRVIGKAGDTIKYQDNQLYVNGEPVKEEYLEPLKASNPGQLVTQNFTLEELTNEKTVPEGEFFVLGDNRPVSKDSRYFGFVHSDQVEGTTNFRFWPLSDFGKIQE